MKVALIFEFGSLNGGEHSMLAVIDQLRACGTEFLALRPASGPLADELSLRGVPAVSFDTRDETGRRRPQDELLNELRDKLLASECDLAHANSLSMGRLTGVVAEDLPMPCTAHLRDIIKVSKTAMRDLNRNTRLIAVSDATRRFHIGQGMDPNRVVTIYNGVDCDKFQPRPPDDSVREELSLSADDFLVLTVGQIGLRKGQDVLAEAAAILEHDLSRACYLLAGQRFSEKQESVDYERRLIDGFEKLGKGDRYRLLGYREDMPRLMNAADLLVHPAHQEPLGRVLLEAAAAGLPIIATDVGGTSEILRDGHSALLVPPNDPQAMAQAIQTLAADERLRERLASNAHDQILARFSIQSAAQNLHRLWAGLL